MRSERRVWWYPGTTKAKVRVAVEDNLRADSMKREEDQSIEIAEDRIGVAVVVADRRKKCDIFAAAAAADRVALAVGVDIVVVAVGRKGEDRLELK